MGELKLVSSCSVVQGLSELVNGGRHFQMLIENCPLPLQSDVVGPFNKAESEIPFRLEVLSSVKILRPFLRQGMEHLLGLLSLHNSRAQHTFFPFAFFPFGIWKVGGGWILLLFNIGERLKVIKMLFLDL